MATIQTTELDREFFERAAWEYYHTLPLEHFMEATVQSMQKEITHQSLRLIHQQRPDIQYFGELLIQWVVDAKRRQLGRVVPDTLVVIHPTPLEVKASFNLSIEEAKPFMAIEYVCNSSQERDYEEKFEIYRDTLHVPYYLTHEPDDLRLHHYDPAGGYVRVAANEHGRFAIPEMETEVGLVDGWARFWFRGELVPFPEELQTQLLDEREKRRKAERAEKKAERARKEAEQGRLAEERARKEAEERAESEARLRLELERQLAELRAKMDEKNKG